MGEIADSLDFNGKTALNVVNVINALSVGLPFFGVSTQSQLPPSHSTKPSPDPVPTKRIPILRPPPSPNRQNVRPEPPTNPYCNQRHLERNPRPHQPNLIRPLHGPTTPHLQHPKPNIQRSQRRPQPNNDRHPHLPKLQRLRRLVHPQPHPTNRSHNLNTRHRSCALDIRDIRNTSPAELLNNASRDWQRPGFRSPFQCLER